MRLQRGTAVLGVGVVEITNWGRGLGVKVRGRGARRTGLARHGNGAATSAEHALAVAAGIAKALLDRGGAAQRYMIGDRAVDQWLALLRENLLRRGRQRRDYI